MSYDFENFNSVKNYASELEKLGAKCSSTEAIAIDSVNYLFNKFGDVDGVRNCALMRFFRTMPYSDLHPYLKEKVRNSLGYEPSESLNCLTLLATRGIEPDWNDRLASVNHQVIPLISAQIVELAPMVAQLVNSLGIDVSQVVDPKPTLFLKPEKKRYNVMYVSEAQEEREVFVQENFVKRFGVRSVIGFGTLLPTGDMIAVLMFMRVLVSEEVASSCSQIAKALEIAINQLQTGKKSGANILIAAAQSDGGRLHGLLNQHHNIISAPTVGQAIKEVNNGNFDLIVCGTNFDDSRMFDLLREFKNQKRERTKPFICFRQSSSLGKEIEGSVKTAAGLLGAAGYLDAAEMNDSDLLDAIQAIYLNEYGIRSKRFVAEDLREHTSAFLL